MDPGLGLSRPRKAGSSARLRGLVLPIPSMCKSYNCQVFGAMVLLSRLKYLKIVETVLKRLIVKLRR